MISSDWCVVTPAVSASATVFKYTIDVKSNSTTDNRTSVITVKGGNLTETFNVIQTATEGLDLETVLFEDISAAGGTITVKVMTNGEPTITINDSWITEKTETRAMVDKTKTFIIAANTGKERTGTITFILGDLPATTVTVKQLAGGEISSNEIAGEDPWTVAKSLGLGWNLGNQLDAHNSGVANETAWGNQKTTQALFDKLAAAGITTVRIPVTWMGHIGDAPGYEIEKAWMDRVAEVVGYAENAGLNAIVNIHHDGADSEYWLSIKDAKPVFTISSIMMNIDNSIQSGIFCISYYLGNTIHPGFLYFITGGVSNMSHPCNRNTYGSNTRSSQFIK